MLHEQPYIPAAELHPNGAVELPYEGAMRAMGEDITSLKRRLRNSQVREGLFLVLFAVAMGAAFFFMFRVIVVTAVVEVAETGMVRNVEMLPRDWKGDTPAIYEYLAEEWLLLMRRMGIDPQRQVADWRKAASYMSDPAIRTADEFAQERRTRLALGEVVEIEEVSTLPMTADSRQMRLEWYERRISQQGVVIESGRWEAVVDLATYTKDNLPPHVKKVQDLRNRVGFFVLHYAWKKMAPIPQEGK